MLTKSWRSERGSVLGEYGIWIVLVIIVAAAALSPLGTQIAKVFRDLYTRLGGT